MSELSSLEREIVDLIEQGYARWKIAQELGLGETTVRSVIRRLCEKYDCASRDLPKVVRRENDADREDRGAA